mgnify:CR=1 FL=1
MAVIEVVEFEQKHLDKIVPKEIHQGEIPNTIMTTAMTFLVNGNPVAIVGGFLFVPGVLHIWAIFSEEIRKTPLAFQKKVLEMLKFYEKDEKLRRIQVEVRVSYLEGQKWIESLGFKQEGRMRAWLPDGSDCFLYSRVGDSCQQ